MLRLVFDFTFISNKRRLGLYTIALYCFIFMISIMSALWQIINPILKNSNNINIYSYFNFTGLFLVVMVTGMAAVIYIYRSIMAMNCKNIYHIRRLEFSKGYLGGFVLLHTASIMCVSILFGLLAAIYSARFLLESICSHFEFKSYSFILFTHEYLIAGTLIIVSLMFVYGIIMYRGIEGKLHPLIRQIVCGK